MKGKQLIVIAGPTASGKTSTSIELAKKLSTEIISADSRQFYREMNIGTAKPAPYELRQVKHHFINTKSIHDPEYNAGQFAHDVHTLLPQLFQKYDQLIMTGGSGLYIKAVTDGLAQMPEVPETIRAILNKSYTQLGLRPLLKELQAKDPDYYAIVDHQNPQRIIRALEVIRSSGKPFSHYRKPVRPDRPFSVVKLAIDLPRNELYSRINNRVDQMIEDGLLEEAHSLYPFKNLIALNTVGYSELYRYFENEWTLEQAIDKIKQHSRNYAKRQLTWLRNAKDYQWLPPIGIVDYFLLNEDQDS